MFASTIQLKTLTMFEREMFLFPRVCRVCHSAAPRCPGGSMITCSTCLFTVWCSDKCREEWKDRHESVCQQLRLARIADRYESQVDLGIPGLPPNLDGEYLGTVPDITQALVIGESEMGNQELEFAFLTNQLSGVFTLLDIGHKFLSDFGTKSSLTVHIAGANINEMMGIIKWEVLAHRLPALRSFYVIFVGPELSKDKKGDHDTMQEQCDNCSSIGRTITYQMYTKTYQDFKRSDSSSEPDPDLVLVQNCGFHEHDVGSREWTEGWKGLGQLLHPVSKAPVIFTSYTKGEAEADMSRFLEHCHRDVDILVNCQENVMRSHRPVRDWDNEDDKDVFYSNQYISVVKLK